MTFTVRAVEIGLRQSVHPQCVWMWHDVWEQTDVDLRARRFGEFGISSDRGDGEDLVVSGLQPRCFDVVEDEGQIRIPLRGTSI